MDVLNAFEGSVRIGKDNNMTNVVEPQLHVAPCDPGPGTVHANDATYAMHHDIDPWLEERMRKYYAPYNQQLYDFLGRDLGWSTDQYGGLSVSVVGRTPASRIITSHRQRDGEWLAYGETRIECRRLRRASRSCRAVSCISGFRHTHTLSPPSTTLILHRVNGTDR